MSYDPRTEEGKHRLPLQPLRPRAGIQEAWLRLRDKELEGDAVEIFVFLVLFKVER